jgi:hypothetical protein
MILWYRGADTISEIRKQRLRRLGHLERIPEVMRVKEVFDPYPTNVQYRVSS